MEVGLLFGSFNPIHVGHLIIAQTMLNSAGLKEVWFVVSPHNPLKKSKSLIHEFDRFDLVERAIEENNRFRASDVEFHLPKPNYTATTLAYLLEKHPEHHFRPIIGEDNLRNFPRWKNHETILEDFGLLVYPRPGVTNSPLKGHPNVQYVEAPLLNISATYIRRLIKEAKPIRYLVPDRVVQLIEQRKLFI